MALALQGRGCSRAPWLGAAPHGRARAIDLLCEDRIARQVYDTGWRLSGKVDDALGYLLPLCARAGLQADLI